MTSWSYEWSPDGRRLVLVIETNEEPSTAAITAKGPKPIVIDSMFFKEDVTGYIGRHQKQHLYLFDIAEAKLEPLAKTEQYNDVSPAWSPDGTKIAFVRTQERAVDMDGKIDIELIEARPGAAPRQLLRPWAPTFQHLAWSADGQSVAFLQGMEPKYSMYMHDELWLAARRRRRGASTYRQARSLDLARTSSSPTTSRYPC